MMERVEKRTILDPRFSGTSEGSLRRWMVAWDRERKALLVNLEPKIEPGEFIPFGLLWVWKQELTEVTT